MGFGVEDCSSSPDLAKPYFLFDFHSFFTYPAFYVPGTAPGTQCKE
jgi:hypothetical protein